MNIESTLYQKYFTPLRTPQEVADPLLQLVKVKGMMVVEEVEAKLKVAPQKWESYPIYVPHPIDDSTEQTHRRDIVLAWKIGYS